jgi:hypothetical protein
MDKMSWPNLGSTATPGINKSRLGHLALEQIWH